MSGNPSTIKTSRLLGYAGAASASQVSRILYSGLIAGLIWSDSDSYTIGLWFTLVSWLGMASLCDLGVSLSIISQVDNIILKHSGRICLKPSAFRLLCKLYITVALAGLVLLLGFFKRIDGSPLAHGTGLAIAAYLGITSSIIAGTLSTILQASGGWLDSHKKASIAYIIAALLSLFLFSVKTPSIIIVALAQALFGVIWFVLLLRHFQFYPQIENHASPEGNIRVEKKLMFSSAFTLCAQRLPMLSASVIMEPTQIGEYGKYYQLTNVVVGASFFAANGLSNKVIGDYQRHKTSVFSAKENRSLLLIGTITATAAGLSAVALTDYLVGRGVLTETTTLSAAQRISISLSATSDLLVYTCLPIASHLTRAPKCGMGLALITALLAPASIGFFASEYFIEARLVSSLLLAGLLFWASRDAFGVRRHSGGGPYA
jgi:hypothetical protein